MELKFEDVVQAVKQTATQPFIYQNINYLVVTGSRAYGVADQDSDYDTYGFCTPPVQYLKPTDYIAGFDQPKHQFDQWLGSDLSVGNVSADVTVFSIAKFFALCMDNNPNMIDSIFVDDKWVVHIDAVGSVIRDNRHQFVDQRLIHKTLGYAMSQLKKVRNLDAYVLEGSRRDRYIEQYGYDVKAAYHVIRLLNQAEQFLDTGTVNLMQNKEQLKDIRSGAFTFDQFIELACDYKPRIEQNLSLGKTVLAKHNDPVVIKSLLETCLEIAYYSKGVE